MTEAAYEDEHRLMRRMFTYGVRLFWLLVAVLAILVVADWMLRTESYPVRQLSLEGPFEQVNRKQIEQAVMPALHGNYLTIKLEDVRERVEALAWVERAWVSRKWPETIHVRFAEQHFVARWGEQAWLNRHGEAVQLPQAMGPMQLVRLDGPQGSEKEVWRHYQAMQRKLDAIGLRIVNLRLSARRTWRIELAEGIELVAGREAPLERIERFVRAYAHVATRMAEIERIDLRYANGFAVKWKQVRAGLVRPVHRIMR